LTYLPASVAAPEGVRITLTDAGKFKFTGPRIAVARAVSLLRPTIETLRSVSCPSDFSSERFERLRAGALRFAAERATETLAVGWTHNDLFRFAEPFARVDIQGAAWFIGDASVTAISTAAITIRTASGATQRIYRIKS
jgi:hypothetical protein